MRWFTTASKAVAQRLATWPNSAQQWIRRGYCINGVGLGSFTRLRSLNCVASLHPFHFGTIGDSHRCSNPRLGSGNFCDRNFGNDIISFNQKRGFLGCGDGDEGSALAKVYEERRVMGYSPEQLYAVVAAVDLYKDFLPWCQHSEIIRRNPDGSFDAELEIGFKFLVESYMSHVELKRPSYIKTTASESGLFDHLINVWEFNPGPAPGTCNLYFLVDFKFQSPFYGQMANMFFKEVVSRLVGSFNDRCRLIYGPGVAVLGDSYEQRV